MRNSPPQSSSNTLHTNTSTLDSAIARGCRKYFATVLYQFPGSLVQLPRRSWYRYRHTTLFSGQCELRTCSWQVCSSENIHYSACDGVTKAKETVSPIPQLTTVLSVCLKLEISERVGCTASPSSWAPAFSVVCYLACRGCLQLARRGRGRRVVTGDISGAAQQRLPGCSG